MVMEPLSEFFMKLENVDLIKGVQMPHHGMSVRLKDDKWTDLELEGNGSVSVTVTAGSRKNFKVIPAVNVACYETSEAAKIAKELDGRSAEEAGPAIGSSVDAGAAKPGRRGRPKVKG